MNEEVTERIENIEMPEDEFEPVVIECKDEKAWLVERAKSIGGSDSATIIGINPFDTPLKLWSRLRGLAPPKPTTEAMQMGKDMEPITDKVVTRTTSRKIDDPGDFTIYRHPDKPYMHATVDRFILNRNPWLIPEYVKLGDGVGEWKNVGVNMIEGSFGGQEWDWREKPPLHTECQVQHNMACTGLQWGMVAAILGGNEFVWYDVMRNERFLEFLSGREREFWALVEEGEQPKATDKDLETIQSLFPDHTPGKIIVLDEEGVDLTGVFDEATVQKKAVDQRLEGAKARMKQIMGSAEMATFPDGTPAWTHKTHFQKGYTKVVEEKNVRTLRRKKKRASKK